MSLCTLSENIAPGTCPVCEAELTALRNLVATVGRLIAANDRASILAPRPDIAWRDVRKAYADIEALEAAR